MFRQPEIKVATRQTNVKDKHITNAIGIMPIPTCLKLLKELIMGLLSFVANAGKKLLGRGKDEENIKNEITSSLSSTSSVDNLEVKVEGDTVKITGDATPETLEKAALIAGNVEGIQNVEVDGVRDDADDNYYTIVKGDNLSKIAKKFYGDANQYNKIFEANREVIKDPNLIYPGQKIRIPK